MAQHMGPSIRIGSGAGVSVAHSPAMRTFVVGRLWRASYLRTVRRSFATVPLYRELWALDGRTDPVLVPGRTGRLDGAVPAETVLRRLADLAPLGVEVGLIDPTRGSGPVLAAGSPDAVRRRPDELGSAACAPGDVLHDELLGYLGRLADCGRWHLDWRRVYARRTAGGLAFTVLGLGSPRLVDVLPSVSSGAAVAEVGPCPRHGTPAVSGESA